MNDPLLDALKALNEAAYAAMKAAMMESGGSQYGHLVQPLKELYWKTDHMVDDYELEAGE